MGLRDVQDISFDESDLSFCSEPSAPGPCPIGGAIFEAGGNPGMVCDREALLAGRDPLAGTATLNWSADLPITSWDGVTVEGTPQRVASLGLSRRGLTGSIPRELGGLSNLRELRLSNNQLDGEIPSELGNLSNLETLRLEFNELSGEIPAKLGRLLQIKRPASLDQLAERRDTVGA